MAKINQPPGGPPGPSWPWGGPRTVREKLVDRTQFDRKKIAKKGDPRNPALASNELLEFIGPGHTAEELRMPPPPMPGGHDADLQGYNDHQQLREVAQWDDPQLAKDIDFSLNQIQAPPDRLERLKALLSRERPMLALLRHFTSEQEEIYRKIREETQEEGF